MSENKTYPISPMNKGPRRAKLPWARAQRWLAAGEDAAQPQLPVFVTQSVFEAISKHAASDLDNEVGGWLAGRWCKDVDTQVEFVVVEALLPAQQVRSGSTFLTFTHDSQVAMLSVLEERYAKKGVVGWYHTHPRMGIFLSGYDVWLHNHFFPQPWQVALVVEPHSKQGGLFVRKAGELDARKYAGFYELRNRRVETVVDWKNLHLEKSEQSQVEPPKPEPPKAEPGLSPAASPKDAGPQGATGEDTEPLNKPAGQVKVTDAQPKKEIKVTEAKQ
jgi:proteasome lid subunit RPN8/RPN11